MSKKIKSYELFICIQLINIIFMTIIIAYIIFGFITSYFSNELSYHHMIDTYINVLSQYTGKNITSKCNYAHIIIVLLLKIYFYIAPLPPGYIIRLEHKSNNICALYKDKFN